MMFLSHLELSHLLTFSHIPLAASMVFHAMQISALEPLIAAAYSNRHFTHIYVEKCYETVVFHYQISC